MESMNVLIADEIGQNGITYLTSNGCSVDTRFSISDKELVSAIALYDALIVRGRTIVTSQIIDAGKRLKVIARAGSGVDNIDMDAARARNIPVVNARGANAEAVAEHAFAFILMLARNMFPAVRALSKGEWTKKTFTAMELEGKTLGIVGLGAIGNRVAQLGRAFGMAVVAYTRTTEGEKYKQIQILGGRFVGLDELLRLSDVVSLHVPSTPETKHLIGKNEFSLMKKSAYLVNTSRGDVVDEIALMEALRSNIIAGAALDVFSEEPLPQNSGFVGLKNVILTPHVASVSHEGAARISQMVVEDVVRVLKGEPPKRLVSHV